MFSSVKLTKRKHQLKSGRIQPRIPSVTRQAMAAAAATDGNRQPASDVHRVTFFFCGKESLPPAGRVDELTPNILMTSADENVHKRSFSFSSFSEFGQNSSILMETSDRNSRGHVIRGLICVCVFVCNELTFPHNVALETGESECGA